jgi:hypothetical protein
MKLPKSTQATSLLRALSETQVRSLKEIEMPWIADDNQRREVVGIITHVKETADQLNEALSLISRIVETETDVLQVKTSISSQALDYMPEEILREEVLRNQASQLAFSIMKHLETTVEKDLIGDVTIYTTTIGIKVPQTSKGTLK